MAVITAQIHNNTRFDLKYLGKLNLTTLNSDEIALETYCLGYVAYKTTNGCFYANGLTSPALLYITSALIPPNSAGFSISSDHILCAAIRLAIFLLLPWPISRSFSTQQAMVNWRWCGRPTSISVS